MNRLLACLAAALLAMALAPARAEPPPIAAFFKQAAIREPRLSPSGRYLAVLAPGQNDRRWLAVIDLQTLGTPRIVGGFNDADVAGHAWVSDERLVFQISNAPDGSTQVAAPGLWAVDRDGTNTRQLIHNSNISYGRLSDRRLSARWFFAGVLPDGSGDVYVQRAPGNDRGERGSLLLARLDTRTGLSKNLSLGLPDGVISWRVDSRGEPRAALATHNGRGLTYLRNTAGEWTLWLDQDPYGGNELDPFWFGPDDQVLVTAPYQGYQALFRLDPATRQPEATPLVSTRGYDFKGVPVFDPDARRLLGLHLETDAPTTVWFDATMKAHQADIDAKLPGSVNIIDCQHCVNAQHLLVTALSDQLPPRYFLYTPADRRLQPLASPRADLRAADMGRRDVLRFQARDGLEIPVLVTHPAGNGKGPAPTVVLVHGGPNVRGTHWPWQREAQFLASRGYLVLEPEFRGSTGYGFKHFQAGWKQWGLTMQDDIADTLAWAVKQGWADPQRACIAGASYGGYAALMGAITQADLFKCAVNWVGVTDIGLLSSIAWSDLSETWERFGMKRLVADPDTDAAQMRATSPLVRAGEIKLPLLMAYGGEDRRVPLKHGTDLKSALRAEQPVQWVVYPEEGHGWFLSKTNEDFWGRVERFLGQHLAPKN